MVNHQMLKVVPSLWHSVAKPLALQCQAYGTTVTGA